MATPLDTTLVQLFTGGVNMPTQAQAEAGYVPRAFVDSAGRVNLEYVAPSTFGADVANVVDSGAAGDGVTNDAAAFTAAIAAGKAEVFIPDGEYLISSAVDFNVADLVITFAPGASIKITPNAGSLTFSGAQQKIDGLDVAITTASSATFSAVTLSGASIEADNFRFTLTADVENCTLLKITGQQTRMRGFRVHANGKAFLNGAHGVAAGGGELKYAGISDVFADVGDDGVATTFGPIVRWRVRHGTIDRVTSESGGRALFPDGVIHLDGHEISLRDPNITTGNGADYGLYIADGAGEILWEGGWIQGTAGAGWRADSEGIYIGHDCYQITFVNTAVTGFDYGVGFHGSCNIPGFFNCDFSNNQTAAVLIDGVTIRGMSFTGCYAENVAGQPLWMWAKTGFVLGCAITGGFIAYTTRVIKVEPTFDQFTGCVIQGVNIIGASGVTSYAIEPGANDSFLWQENYLQVSNNIATGAYAANVRQQNSDDLELAGLVVGTHGTSTANNRHTQILTDIYTANFGTVNAGATVALTFSYTGVATVTTGMVDATMAGNLGAFCVQGILFQWYAHSANTIGGTATNITGSPIAAVTGAVRFRVTIFG